MIRFFAAIAAVFVSTVVAAQEAEPESIQLPFDIEMGKTLTLNTTLTQEEGGARLVATETAELTPLKVDGDKVLYRYKTTGADLVSAEGMPPFMLPLLEKMAAESKGLSFEYAADATGYPDTLTKYKRITKFMQGVGQDLVEWAKKYAVSEGLTGQQATILAGAIQQSIAPYMTEDVDSLSRLVLEEGQIIFSATARTMYPGYYSQSKGTRFFLPGNAYFYTDDNWALESYDEDAGQAVITWDSTLHPQEYEAFLTRYHANLTEENGPEMAEAIETEINKYRNLKLTRTGRYTIDLSNGLPGEGSVRSETIWEGNTEVETIDFTLNY